MALNPGALQVLDDAARQAYSFAKHWLGNTAAEHIVRTYGPEAVVAAVTHYNPAAGAAAASTLKVVRQLQGEKGDTRPAGNVPRPSGAPIKTYSEPIPGVRSRTNDIVTKKEYHANVLNTGKIEDSYNTKTTNYYSSSSTTIMPRYYNPRRRYGRRIFRRRVRRVPYSRRRVNRRRFITVPRTMQTYGQSAMRAIGQLKFVDEALVASATVTSSWTFTPMCKNIAQGTSMITRIGNRILLKKLYITGQTWRPDAAATGALDDVDTWVKFVVVLDTQNNSTDNSALMAAAGGLYDTTDFLSKRNLYRVGRYRIIHESILNITSTILVNTAGTGYAMTQAAKPIEVVLPLNIILEYNQSASTGAVATMPSNALYFGYVCMAVGSGPYMSINVRTRFKDLQ